MAAKRAKQSAAQAKKEEEERLMKEAQLAREQAEAAERARIEAKRQEREAQKKALKKERKLLRDLCKSNNYFLDSNNTNNSEETLKLMTTIENICENLSLSELEELNKNLKNNGKPAFLKAIKDEELRREQERLENLRLANNSKDKKTKEEAVVKVVAEWNEDNIQLLVKAVNLFPAGTNQRWEVVANFINQHGKFAPDSSQFNAKQVLAKAKDLQNADFTKNNLKEVANKQAFDNFKKDKKNVLNIDESGISKNIEGNLANGNAQPPVNGESKKEVPWTAQEQQLLEQALKTYPASTAERWDRIAECIPNRSKKECMKRYKELVETVKAKKAAQAALNK